MREINRDEVFCVFFFFLGWFGEKHGSTGPNCLFWEKGYDHQSK